MNEVSIRQVDALLRAAALCEVPPGVLPTVAPDSEGRISWDQFVEFMEDFTAAVGGPEGLDRIGGEWHRLYPWVQPIAKMFPTPRDFYAFYLGPVTTSAFLNFKVTVHEEPPDWIRVEVRLRPSDRDCPGFWRVNVSVLGAAARWFDQPAGLVEMSVDGQLGTYRIKLPSARDDTPLRDDAVQVLAAAKRMEAAHAALLAANADLREGASLSDSKRFSMRVEALIGYWRLTDRESDVLSALAAGAGNKQIADDLGCGLSNVEVHVRHLFDKSGTESRARLIAVFWAGA